MVYQFCYSYYPYIYTLSTVFLCIRLRPTLIYFLTNEVNNCLERFVLSLFFFYIPVPGPFSEMLFFHQILFTFNLFQAHIPLSQLFNYPIFIFTRNFFYIFISKERTFYPILRFGPSRGGRD